MKCLTSITIVCIAAIALAACTSAPLKPAPDIAVSAGITQTQVKHSIMQALQGRGWAIDQIGTKQILSTLHVRNHAATVRIDFDTQAIHITYMHSTHLSYRNHNGTQFIHRNYNSWIQYLEQDIKLGLQNMRAHDTD